jgi:creatinine amidohydrolase/Fe(II)-dependent formamide hydrolase-like protein
MVASPKGPTQTELAKKIRARMRRYFEVHSGPRETAYALHYFPELVEMERLEDWRSTFKVNPRLMEFMDPDRDDYELVSQVFMASLEPDTDDFTSSGQYATTDPRTANPEEAARYIEERLQFLVDFINLWKSIPLPPAYRG